MTSFSENKTKSWADSSVDDDDDDLYSLPLVIDGVQNEQNIQNIVSIQDEKHIPSQSPNKMLPISKPIQREQQQIQQQQFHQQPNQQFQQFHQNHQRQQYAQYQQIQQYPQQQQQQYPQNQQYPQYQQQYPQNQQYPQYQQQYPQNQQQYPQNQQYPQYQQQYPQQQQYTQNQQQYPQYPQYQQQYPQYQQQYQQQYPQQQQQYPQQQYYQQQQQFPQQQQTFRQQQQLFPQQQSPQKQEVPIVSSVVQKPPQLSSQQLSPQKPQQSDQDQSEFCHHKGIVRQLILAALLFTYKKIEKIPWDDITLKFKCSSCEPPVLINVVSLGKNFRKETYHIAFYKIKEDSIKNIIVDYTNVIVPYELKTKAIGLLFGNSVKEDSYVQTKTQQQTTSVSAAFKGTAVSSPPVTPPELDSLVNFPELSKTSKTTK